MMGKTHISVGIASALLIARPADLGGCLVAVIGGAVGGVMCDIEVRSNPRCRDALHARFIVVGIVAVALLVDAAIGGPLTQAVNDGNRVLMGIGATLVIGTAVYSRIWSKHRGFSHSILALALFSVGLLALLPQLAAAFALGFASHVLLDLLNKMPVQIFYPSKRGRLCLRLCYASGATNTAFMWAGTLGIVVGVMLALTGLA
jgi:inner membrane protein